MREGPLLPEPTPLGPPAERSHRISASIAACHSAASWSVHVPIVDVPAVLAFGISAEGESGYAPIPAGLPGLRRPPSRRRS
jgi:hypothetical protein